MGVVLRKNTGAGNSQGSSYKGSFTNYTDLTTQLPTGNLGDLAVVENSQGTSWLPWTLGGTYYPKGTYYWDGSKWGSNVEGIAEKLQQLTNISLAPNGSNMPYDWNTVLTAGVYRGNGSTTNQPDTFAGFETVFVYTPIGTSYIVQEAINGTGNGHATRRSNDGGASWSNWKISLNNLTAGTGINIDKTDPRNYVLSATGFDNGWARYKDTIRTNIGTALVISEGTGFQPILNNKGDVIETYLPPSVTTFYDGTLITPETVGDYYEFSIRFKGQSSKVGGRFDIGIDIGGTQGVIFKQTLTFAKGANTEQEYSISFGGFTLNTFIANGGQVVLMSDNGDTSVYNIEYQIAQIYRA